MFPTWFHGSGATMWYPQFICHQVYPSKSIYLASVSANNTRHKSHKDESKKTYIHPKVVKNNFAKLLCNYDDILKFKDWKEFSDANINNLGDMHISSKKN